MEKALCQGSSRARASLDNERRLFLFDYAHLLFIPVQKFCAPLCGRGAEPNSSSWFLQQSPKGNSAEGKLCNLWERPGSALVKRSEGRVADQG